MADLKTLALNLLENGPHKIESTPRRVRALYDGIWLFDTTSAVWVWEHKYFPQFWIPISAVSSELLTKGDSINDAGTIFTATIKGKEKSTDRVLIFEEGPLKDLVRFEFTALDAWFEEDVQVYGHPKNPYTRIDILPSSRKIEVKIGGITIADSANPSFLFETGLRTRYYLPKTAVDWKYLSNSTTTSKCPYKGLAQYYHVTINGQKYEDVIWWYEYPIAESTTIQGMVCFYNEKVDIYVDGVLEKK